MKFIKNENWGLKLLALILAIVIYHAMKSDTGKTSTHHDRTFFQTN